MKFLLLSPKNRTTYNFRGDLLKEIRSRGYEVVATGPDRTDVDRIEALGARFIEVPVDKNGTSIWGDIRYCRNLIRLMKEEKPDAVLGYTVKPAVYGAIAAKIAGVRNINSMITGGGYTFISTNLKARVLGFIVRTLYRIGLTQAHHVIFQNKDDLEEFTARHLVKRGKCFLVNGSGVNMEHFKPAPLPEKTTFFMLSRLLKNKGVREYLLAAKALKKEHPELRFCLLGKYEEKMQDAIPVEQIEPYISSGIVERFEETDDVRPYYEQCSVYVLPSYREGTPRTVLEAMAMGRAIITTDTNGCRETVIEGENGYLVPVRDVKTLARRMKYLAEHPDVIKNMGEKSRAYAEEKFAVDKVNAEMIRIMNL